MSNGRAKLGDCEVDMNENEFKLYLIMKEAVKEEVEPVCRIAHRNKTSITYLKWAVTGLGTVVLALTGMLITVAVG
jgi:hypothetical protein